MTSKKSLRLLSILLALSLLLPNLLIGGVSAVETIPEIPESMTRVVFVDSNATGTGDGLSPVNAYTSLEAAFADLDGAESVIDESDAVIVISGTVNVSASYNPTGFDHAHTGTYYITSAYGTYDFASTAAIVFSGSERINMNFFGKTFWSNVKLKADTAEVVLYSYTGLTFGAGVNTVMENGGTISVQAGMAHNHLMGEGTISVAIYSGTLTNLAASSDVISGSDVDGLTHWGIALPLTITVGGSANIGNLAVGNKGLTGDVTVFVTGGTVTNFYTSGYDGTYCNGKMILYLSGGTVQYMGDAPGITNCRFFGNITVNISGTFSDASGNYGGWGAGTTVAGTKMLNLSGYTQTFVKDAFANYDQTNLEDNSAITYVAELGSDTAVTVASGSTLNLLNNKDTDTLNITNKGTVSYGASVYLDQTYGLDTNAGTQAAPVQTMEKAYELLPYGGVINVVGEYAFTYSGASTNLLVITMPASAGKIYITSADPTNPSALSFETGTKTNVQFMSPTEITNIKWDYDHVGTNGKKGNMNLYTGPSLTIGNGVTTNCTGCGGVGTGCIAIRGGWYYHTSAPAVTGDDYSSRDIEVTVNSGDWSYINGGHEGGNTANYAPVGNVTQNIGGTANIKQRVQLAGSNGGSVHGDSTLNVTGGTVSEIVLIGHGKSDSYVATIHGNATVNVTGGVVTSIITSRNAYEKVVGDLTLNISGTGEVGTVSLEAAHFDAAKKQVINMSGTGSLDTLTGGAWDSLNVLTGAEAKFLGAYNASLVAALNVEDGAVLQLSAANNTQVPNYNKVGPNETGKVVLKTEHIIEAVAAKAAEEHVGGWNAHYRCTVCDKYFTDEVGINETTLEALTIPATDSLTHHDYDGNLDEGTHVLDVTGGQGNAIHGNILVTCTKYGECTLYDMLTGNEIASFNLGSYNGGTLPEDPNLVGDTAKGNWANHSNQIMFGTAKFDDNDPLPLLYVTTGNSGKHDGTGAYIAKMAIERILYSQTKGWYAETVQIIEFNDVANIPEQSGNPYKNMNNNNNAENDVLTNMRDPETGKFLYISGNGYDAAKGYQKVGWGWPAWFVDSKPTADTEGKIYIKSARYRTTRAYEPHNKNTYGIDDYFDGGNAYIVTEFNMPALPTSISEADGYGATVTLYTKDIQDQFELEYTYGFTQGGTMYNGRIYYSYGNGKNADANNAEYAKYVTNAIQVVDIASEKIIAKLDITGTNMGGAREPECCSIWNGELMLGMNGPNGYEMYSLGYVAIDGETSEPDCTTNSITKIVCSLCGEELGERENDGTKLEHSFDGVGGACTNGCEKKECEYTGNHESVYVHVEGTNTHHRVCILCEGVLEENISCFDDANDRDHTCNFCDNTAAITEHQSDSVACCDGLCVSCGEEMPATEGHDWSDGDGVCNTCGNHCTDIMNGHDWSNNDGICAICGIECQHESDSAACIDGVCTDCGIEMPATEDHDWSNNDGICADCETECQHESDSAACADGVCVHCGMEVPATEDHDPADLEYLQNDHGIHDVFCNACGDVIAEQEACTYEDHQCKYCEGKEWISVIFMDGDSVFIESGAAYGNPLGIAGMPTPAVPEGKEWAGWYTEDGIRVQHGMIVTSNLVAYATWKDATLPDTGDSTNLIPAVVLGVLAVTGTALLVTKKSLFK